MPSPPFGVLRNGEPIAAVPLRNTVTTGIEYADPRIDLGLIPEVEERSAAVFAAVPWTVWVDMPTDERAAIVAHRRIHLLTQLHSEDAVQQAVERRQREHSQKAI